MTAASVPKSLRDTWLLTALEREKALPPDSLAALRNEAPEWVAAAAVAKDPASAETITALAARAAHVPVADLGAADPAAAQFVPEAVARQYAALPLSATSKTIRIATANPLDLDAEQALGFVAGRQVEFLYALPQALLARLDEVYRPERSMERLVGGLAAKATVGPAVETRVAGAPSEAPAARLVEAAIADAVRERASHILFEPFEDGLVVRYRIDGVMKEVTRIPRSGAGSVVRRLKVLARLDIADPLRAHEGRSSARVDGKAWDLLVASAPIARYGEQVTVRLSDPLAPPPALASLGLWPDEQAKLERLLTHREGVLLWMGPRGGGKVQAMYACLEHLRAAGVEVATVEDPVAYHLPGAKQFAVDEAAGAGYGATLRTALKSEAAAFLVGTIRDGDTAATAWQAALDGHLVLTSLRTADPASGLARLQTLGVEPSRIAAAAKGIVTQRLVRRLCPECAEPADPSLLPQASRPPQAFERPVAVRKAKGCAPCGFTGYRGTFAVQEVIAVEGKVAELIAAGAPEAQVTRAARQAGTAPLWQAGIRRVWAGETSYEELVRILGEPAPEAAAAPAPAPPAAASEPAAPQPLVLVADDDPAMRTLITTILTSQAFAVAEAADGQDALDQAQRLNPAILLLDMEMPRLDGFGVLEALRQRLAGRSVPVIVVTARDDPATEARCIEMGAEDYLTKPIQPSSLVVRIRAVLRRVGVRGPWPRS